MSDFNSDLEKTFERCSLSNKDKLINFPRFVNRRDVATFLNRYEIFKLITQVHGSVIECGVNLGAGFFSWLHFSSILEPYNSSRHIIGFDTFDGFQSVTKEDEKGIYAEDRWVEFSAKQSYTEIMDSVATQNVNRPLANLEKMSLIQGDASKTIPSYIENNPHTLIALLHIDFDIFLPTKIALEQFLPRMSRGSIIAFDDLNAHEGPGETLAYLEALDIKKYSLRRNVFDSYLSYIVLE